MDDQDTSQERDDRQYTPEGLRQRWVDISDAAMEEFDRRSAEYITAVEEGYSGGHVREVGDCLTAAVAMVNTAQVWIARIDAHQAKEKETMSDDPV